MQRKANRVKHNRHQRWQSFSRDLGERKKKQQSSSVLWRANELKKKPPYFVAYICFRLAFILYRNQPWKCNSKQRQKRSKLWVSRMINAADFYGGHGMTAACDVTKSENFSKDSLLLLLHPAEWQASYTCFSYEEVHKTETHICSKWQTWKNSGASFRQQKSEIYSTDPFIHAQPSHIHRSLHIANKGYLQKNEIDRRLTLAC